MKKNGFTLVELLAVIVLISVLTVIGSGIVIGSLGETKDDINKIQEKKIISAVETYIVDNPDICDSTCIIFVDTLVSQGYIDESDNVTGGVVVTDYGNNKYTYTYKSTLIAPKDVVVVTTLALEDSEIKTQAQSFPLTVSNTTSEHLNTTIKLTDIKIDDALKDVDFRWGLYNADTNKGVAFGIFKYSETGKEEIIYRDYIIDAGAPDKNYILRIWLHDDGTDQASLLNKNFSANIEVVQEPIEYTPESCFTLGLVTLKGYNVAACGTNVVIPKMMSETMKEYGGVVNINEISSNAFQNKGLTSVIISDDIVNILDNTLSNNNLTHVTLPQSIDYISGSSFRDNNNLTSVIIPEGIYEISGDAFAGCNLKTVVLPGDIRLEGAIFDNNPNLTDVVLMDGLTTINEGTFGTNNNVTSIEIPSSVTTIVNNAFLSSSLTEIVVRGKSSLSDFKDSTGLTTEGGLPSGTKITFRP